MITIKLSNLEARLCRDAAKLGKSKIFVDAGDVTLPRGDWCDLAQWLPWVATDMEIRRELSDRKAAEALAARIDELIGRWDCITPAEPEPADVVKVQKALFV